MMTYRLAETDGRKVVPKHTGADFHVRPHWDSYTLSGEGATGPHARRRHIWVFDRL